MCSHSFVRLFLGIRVFDSPSPCRNRSHASCDFFTEVIEEIRHAFDILKANGVSITSSYGEGQNAGESGLSGVAIPINLTHPQRI